MNPAVQVNLALILFLPWFVILAALFWWYPRAPRSLNRWMFDVASLTVATLAAAAGMHWSYYNADAHAGAIWKQVLASTVSYALFLLVMTLAFCARRALIARRWNAPSHATESLSGTTS